MHCKQCGEAFPRNQKYDMWSLRKDHVMPMDAEGLVNSVQLEDAGIFCCRKCIFDYLKPSERSGVFAPAPRQT